MKLLWFMFLTLLPALLIVGCGADEDDGQSSAPGPCAAPAGTPGEILWTLSGTREFRGSPTVDATGNVYVGNESGILYKLAPTGETLWEFDCCIGQPTPEPDPEFGGQLCNVDSTPAIDRDGNLWFGCWNGSLIKMTPDKEELCRHLAQDEVSSSPAIDVDGTVYVGSEDRKLWAVDGSDCSLKWSKSFPDGSVYGSPAVTPAGVIISTSADDHIYAWTRTGQKLWQVETGFDVYSSAALAADGTIYVGSGDHRLYALDAYGRVLWTFRANHRIDTSPVIGPDGTIYAGSRDSNLYAVNPDGTLKWAFATGDEIRSSAVVGCDGTVYVASFDNTLYAINPDGTEAWRVLLDGDVFASPTLSDEGTLYIGTHGGATGGTFYAIRSQSGRLADSDWPQLKGDRYRRGHACSSDFSQCPCASEPTCDSGHACGLELCTGVDDNCDGQVDEGGICDVCLGEECPASEPPTPPAAEGQKPGDVMWLVPTGDSVITVGAAANGGDVYVGSGDYSMYKIDANGQIKCTYETFYRADGVPLITESGDVWFGSEDQVLHGIDSSCQPLCPEGNLIDTGGNVLGRPVELSNGRLAFASGDGTIYEADPGGCGKEAVVSLGGTIYASAAWVGDVIFMGSNAGNFVAVDARERQVQWLREDLGQIVAGAAITPDELLVAFASKTGALYIVNAGDGDDVWQTELGSGVWSTPLFDSQGRLVIATLDGAIRRFEPEETSWREEWVYQANAPIRGPLAQGQGRIYAASDDGLVHAVAGDTGEGLWTSDTGAPLGASGPLITSDGRLVIGNDAGWVLSLRL